MSKKKGILGRFLSDCISLKENFKKKFNTFKTKITERTL